MVKYKKSRDEKGGQNIKLYTNIYIQIQKYKILKESKAIIVVLLKCYYYYY